MKEYPPNFYDEILSYYEWVESFGKITSSSGIFINKKKLNEKKK